MEGLEVEKLLSLNLSAFPALWPAVTCNVVRRNGLKHFRNQHAPFRAIKIIAPARRGGEKRVKIRLCKSQRAVPIWNTHEVSFDWTMEEFMGNSLSFSVFQSSAQMFLLRAAALDAFMSDGYFLGSKSGDCIMFEIMSLLLAYLGFTCCLCEMPSPIFLKHNGAIIFSLFFSLTRSECSLKTMLFFLVFERWRQEEIVNMD